MDKILTELSNALKALDALLSQLFPSPNYDYSIKKLPMNKPDIYATAVKNLGKDLSKIADNSVACVESVCRIIKEAAPELNFPILLSTEELFAYLIKSPSFAQVSIPQKGDIIISVSENRGSKRIHGHTGVVGQHRGPDGTLWIMSNSSDSGKWEANYSYGSWLRAFQDRRQLSTFCFSLL